MSFLIFISLLFYSHYFLVLLLFCRSRVVRPRHFLSLPEGGGPQPENAFVFSSAPQKLLSFLQIPSNHRYHHHTQPLHHTSASTSSVHLLPLSTRLPPPPPSSTSHSTPVSLIHLHDIPQYRSSPSSSLLSSLLPRSVPPSRLSLRRPPPLPPPLAHQPPSCRTLPSALRAPLDRLSPKST